jgi:hypothetical protein
MNRIKSGRSKENKEGNIVFKLCRFRGSFNRRLKGYGQKKAAAKNYSSPRSKLGRGWPRVRWINDVEDDLRKLGVKRWRTKALDRVEWASIVR